MVCTCSDLWDCSKNPKKCEQPMPVPGEGDWNCTWSEGEYVCKGRPDNPPNGGNGWDCSFNVLEFGWVCKKSPPPNPSNKPEGAGVWTCSVDNEHDMLRCERSEETPPPQSGSGNGPGPGSGNPPPPPPPPPEGGTECIPGAKMWCDGLQYCGWGQVVCGPDGKWKRTFFGLGPLDCQELPDGRRPDTQCACYHTFYKEECCEQPDCIVPPGTNGQICPVSPGKLCDYCNPMNSECSEVGGKCIVTNANETFCGRGCAADNPCPGGYQCMGLTVSGGTTNQCVPDDLSCFY
jgi:hypothetical protein